MIKDSIVQREFHAHPYTSSCFLGTLWRNVKAIHNWSSVERELSKFNISVHKNRLLQEWIFYHYSTDEVYRRQNKMKYWVLKGLISTYGLEITEKRVNNIEYEKDKELYQKILKRIKEE